jgi:hypothetical protein
MKASQQAIERGVKDCLFVDYKRRSGHFDVTTVASIKEITEKVPIALARGLGACWDFRVGLPVCGSGLLRLWPSVLALSELTVSWSSESCSWAHPPHCCASLLL